MARVVVTGLGLVTPLGIGVKKSWSRILSGDSAIRSTAELSEGFQSISSKVAAWISNIELERHLESERDLKALPKYIQFAALAADEAIKDANIDCHSSLGGVSVGCGMAPLDQIGEAQITLEQRGARRVSPHLIPRILPNMAASHISIRHRLTGPLLSASTACATGAHSIGDAFRWIKHGYVKYMVSGGTEAAVNPLSMAGFAQARALSTAFNSHPSQSSRPFDKDRDGFVIGEGAGVLVLEDLAHALSRGARIYAEITGYGCSADAFHITASHPDGMGAELAMKNALVESGLSPKHVDHVNVHATSTPLGDRAEARAIERLLGGTNPLVTANKGSIGHLLGAAGAVEAIFTILSLHEQIIPPTLNFCSSDASIQNMRLICNATHHTFQTALCNSFGFGGTNASLCLVQYKV